MQKKVHTILLFLFLANTKLCTASTPLDWDANLTTPNTHADSISAISAKQKDKKFYWGIGTTTIGYLGGFVMQAVDGFIGYKISNKLSIENQLSYYQGRVLLSTNNGWDWYYAKGRYFSNNIRIKTKPFNRLPLFVSMGYKSEFNFYFHRPSHQDMWEKPIEAVTINNKLRYWNSLYSFCLHYTVAAKINYSIDVLLPVFFSDRSLGIYYTTKRKVFYDQYATERLNCGLGLHIKF